MKIYINRASYIFEYKCRTINCHHQNSRTNEERKLATITKKIAKSTTKQQEK